MATGAMLWGGAAYNNGILPFKRYILGEAYTHDGEPAMLETPVELTEAMKARGVLPQLLPLPAWQTVPPADAFRSSSAAGATSSASSPRSACPTRSARSSGSRSRAGPTSGSRTAAPGTGLRVAIPVLNITKTRLNDPFTWFLGTNDQPGDYRSSGCGGATSSTPTTASRATPGRTPRFGHDGTSQQVDPTIPKDEPGHPLRHEFTRAIPTASA